MSLTQTLPNWTYPAMGSSVPHGHNHVFTSVHGLSLIKFILQLYCCLDNIQYWYFTYSQKLLCHLMLPLISCISVPDIYKATHHVHWLGPWYFWYCVTSYCTNVVNECWYSCFGFKYWHTLNILIVGFMLAVDPHMIRWKLSNKYGWMDGLMFYSVKHTTFTL